MNISTSRSSSGEDVRRFFECAIPAPVQRENHLSAAVGRALSSAGRKIVVRAVLNTGTPKPAEPPVQHSLAHEKEPFAMRLSCPLPDVRCAQGDLIRYTDSIRLVS
jgi:hypothetical protein